MNVQGACDQQCCFLFLGVAGPGIIGEREAINTGSLGEMIEALPGLFCAIGECGYTPTTHLVPILRGEQELLKRNDNLNFFASQLRV
jgi:hypothetical protein